MRRKLLFWGGVLVLLSLWVLWPEAQVRSRANSNIKQIGSSLDSSLSPIKAASTGEVLDAPWPQKFRDPVRSGAILELFSEQNNALLHDSEVFIGAPGIYPPMDLVVDGGGQVHIPYDALPALDKTSALEHLEVFVHTFYKKGKHVGFWSDVHFKNTSMSTDPVEVEVPRQRVGLVDAPPLVLRIHSALNVPMPGAKVKLSRSLVGLLRFDKSTEVSGVVSFLGIPPGRYLVRIEAEGHLDEEFVLDHGPKHKEHPIMLSSGRMIFGRVVDEHGIGVPEAFVAVHVEKYGVSKVMDAAQLMFIDALPVRGVAYSDTSGYFAISGLPKGMAYVTAQRGFGLSARAAPADLGDVEDFGPVTVRFVPGLTIDVLVVDDESRPVGNSTVRWRDERTGMEYVHQADEYGHVRLYGVPHTASVRANLKLWASSWHTIRSFGPLTKEYAMTLKLEEPHKSQQWSMRMDLASAAREVSVKRIRFVRTTRKSDRVCLGESKDDRDWTFVSCDTGRGMMHVETQRHGVYSLERVWEDGVEWMLPAPHPVVVNIQGLGPETKASTLHWSTTQGSLEGRHEAVLSKIGSTVVWTHHLYPGTYQLHLQTPTLSRTMDLVVSPAERGTKVWKIDRPRDFSVFVVDERNTPLKGARVELWSEHKRVDAKVSGGSGGSVFRVRADRAYEVYAFHARVGAGMARINAQAKGQERLELVVALSRPLLKVAWTQEAVKDRGEVENILEASLVRDDRALLVDAFDPKSRVRRAGVARGTRFMALRRLKKKNSYELMYEDASGGVQVVELGK